ncbi:MAG: hypothetical protein RL557_546 [archaeon]|jgi:predicted transcriptional regulator
MTEKLFLKKRILELATRKKIYELVKKYEGSHFRELERISRLPASSLKYHLDYLTRHDLITEEKNRNTLCYFSHELDVDKELLMLLRQKSIRNLLLFLMIREQCSFEEMVRFLQLSPSTVSWHAKRLKLKKMLTVGKEGRQTYYKLAIDKQHIMNLLIIYQESFFDSLVDKAIALWDV